MLLFWRTEFQRDWFWFRVWFGDWLCLFLWGVAFWARGQRKKKKKKEKETLKKEIKLALNRQACVVLGGFRIGGGEG